MKQRFFGMIAIAMVAIATTLAACGPGTPGMEALCGPAPTSPECTNPKCVCFLTQCGWNCGAWDDGETPGNGWNVNDNGIWSPPSVDGGQ